MRVVLLMGGSSTERSVSLATGVGVARALSANGHKVLALDPAHGRRLDLQALAGHRIGTAPGSEETARDNERSLVLAGNTDLAAAEVVFVALHGGIGEDGTLQALLDLAGVPYTGSGMLACALAMDKDRAKKMFRSARIPTPRGRLLGSEEGVALAARVREDRTAGDGEGTGTRRSASGFDPQGVGGFPLVVKPNAQGSSVAVHIVEKEADLPAAFEEAAGYGPVLVEEFIPGREITVAVLGGNALPVIEVVPEGGFYDFRHKYTSGETRYVVPADLPTAIAEEAARLAELAFRTLGCGGVARVDFRLAEDGNLFCLEVNTIPGMTETSLVPMAAKAAGMSYEELVERLVADGARRGRRSGT